ncbi:MAG TPA: hypothetical protein VIR26_10310 [Metalysinibacillus sp.]
MKRSSLRAFGIGLFLAGVLAFFYEQLPANAPSVEQATTTKEEKPAKPATEKPKPVEKKSAKEASPQTEQPKGDVIYQLKIYSGATPTSIAADLKTAGIIDDPEDAEIFLSTDKYARSIQVGVYNITDDMTLEDIAVAITK